MKHLTTLSLFLTLSLSPLWLSTISAAPRGEHQLMGFFGPDSELQLKLEATFEELLQADNIGSWIKKLSARPHHVGSPYGKEVAEFVAKQFSSWGYETSIEEFHVLFPTPKVRLVEMVYPETFKAVLQESPLTEDSTSGQTEEQLPAYNAFSSDGDVTAELLYVNYGVPSDYRLLASMGIDVKGKIVIARYGGSWRGIKPKVAAENGAVGCLLFSDPRDDGYFQGDPYPSGPYRNESGVQRGSVVDMPIYPGDPLTPGEGAVPNAKRLELSEAPTIVRIPVLPISYSDAMPLLRAMEGPVAPPAWRGALPITYHVGPGPAKVRLKVEFNWELKPAYDVIARLEGLERSDQWIIRGNHHDAWVNGASDPISGLAAMMEEARAIGELARRGWRPRRSIVYAAWDAEEPGLLGSTEWVELHASELAEHAAVYINSDSNGRGFLSMGGSHALEAFMNQVAKSVTDPQTGVSVWERRRALLISRSSMEAGRRIRNQKDLHLSALGSGSDYTPFLQHLGIPSLNLGYGGESPGGVYHSIYDSFDHYSRFGDPGFSYGVTLAETAGKAVLRLANSAILPFQFTNSVRTIRTYVDQVEQLAERMRSDAREHNLRVRERVATLAADPLKPFVTPQAKVEVPHLNFAPLKNAVSQLQEAAAEYHRSVRRLSASSELLPDELKRDIDRALRSSEQALIFEQGLPGRPWYRHSLYAPGLYTGYGVKTLPAVREAIEQGKWTQAEEQIVLTAEALVKYVRVIENASRIIEIND